MEDFTTLSQAIEALKKEGYTEDFNLDSDCIACGTDKIRISPTDFHIDRVYRFDVNTDAGDQSILYAISSEKHNLKGLLVNGYGIYSDDLTDDMAIKLK